MKENPVIIAGAGPAGLAAGEELARRGLRPLILESAGQVGGISRTECYKGYRFDIGGHRFFTKNEQVQRLWRGMLGDDFLTVPRSSRIYYNGLFFDYPLRLVNALGTLGFAESARIMLSYGRARLFPAPEEKSFEQWVSNRFGYRLYNTFFKVYTEKVWGIPCSEIQADWAAQRIQGLSPVTILQNALFGSKKAKTLIDEFEFPALGAGMMWERFAEAIASAGGQLRLGAELAGVTLEGGRVASVAVREGGRIARLPVGHLISSIPLSRLVALFEPSPPREILEAAAKLSYRAFVLVLLIVDRKTLFPDQWIYIHSPEVEVGRIQNFGNWSPRMVPDPEKAGVGMEYFCNEGDALWNRPDAELIDTAAKELAALGLARREEVRDGCVLRQPHAYPIYDGGFKERLERIRGYLRGIENLQTIGRGGMHRYNNMDHSMVTGILAARNVLGASHDPWAVNEEAEYHEEWKAPGPRA